MSSFVHKDMGVVTVLKLELVDTSNGTAGADKNSVPRSLHGVNKASITSSSIRFEGQFLIIGFNKIRNELVSNQNYQRTLSLLIRSNLLRKGSQTMQINQI